MIKMSEHQEYITIMNTYVPNIRALKYIRQMLRDLKGEIDNNTIIVWDFNTYSQQWIDHPENQQGNIGIEPYSRTNGLNIHL